MGGINRGKRKRAPRRIVADTDQRAKLSAHQVRRAINKLRTQLCSEPWVEAVVFRAEKYGPDAPCFCESCRGLRKWPRNFVGSIGLGERDVISFECYLDGLRISEDPDVIALTPSAISAI